MAEATDSKSVQCAFKSHLGYQFNMKVPISPRPEEVFLFKLKGKWWLTQYDHIYYLVHACIKNTGLLGYDTRKDAIDCVVCQRIPSSDILDKAIILVKLLE